MTSRITVNNIESNSGIASIALDTGVTIAEGSGLNVSSGIVTAKTFSGNIIGVAATFTGAVTYEDVTNVDSVGVVTARQGIRVGAGKSIGSDSGTVTYYGDGSNLSGISDTDTLSHRNKLYNPDFKIWQRGTSFSPTTSGIYSADRWNNANGASFNQDTTVTRSTDVPTNAGSSYSIKIEADAAVTPSGGENMVFRQRLEGQDLQDFDFGGANAKSLVASFWCKCNSSAAGAYSFSPRFFDSSGNGYGQIHNFTPTTSWARYTFVLPANGKALDTAIINSNGVGFEFAIHLATGSSDVVSAHSTWASQGWAGTGSKNFMDDAANEIYFTGFQLEAGSAVTDLEVRSYGDELLRCMRYYWRMVDGADMVGGATSVGVIIGWATNEVDLPVRFPVPMRIVPALEQQGGTNYYQIEGAGSSSKVNGNFTLQFGNVMGANIYAAPSSNVTAGNAYHLTLRNAAAFIAFNADI